MLIQEVTASYVEVWTPKKNLSGELKYSMAVLIPKTSTKELKKIKKEIGEAIQRGIDKGKITKAHAASSSFKLPLRDGDEEFEDKRKGPEFKGMVFFNASNVNPVGIVNSRVQPIIDPTEFYSGCVCVVDIGFYAFNTGGSKGIAAGLNNIMKLRDGDRFDGRQSAETAFESFKSKETDDQRVPDDTDTPF